MKKSTRAAQARRDLDRKFAAADLAPVRHRPVAGWIRSVRNALGMTQAALGQRLGVEGATVQALERSEVNQTVSLGKLARAAEAMDCTLVYALVPNKTLDATVQGEARRLAEETLRRVGTTMALEAQGLDEEDMRVQLDAETQRIIDASRLWRST